MITRAQGAKKNPGTNISQLTGVGSAKFIYVDMYLVLHVKSIFFSVRRYVLQISNNGQR